MKYLITILILTMPLMASANNYNRYNTNPLTYSGLNQPNYGVNNPIPGKGQQPSNSLYYYGVGIRELNHIANPDYQDDLDYDYNQDSCDFDRW